MLRKTTIASALWLFMSGLASAASISGTVTSELTGQPLPMEEYPVVTVYKYDTKANLWNYANSTTTDQSGNFKLTDLPAGYYYIYSNAAHYNGEYYDNTSSWELKKLIKLSATKDLILQNIALKPFPLYVNSLTQSVYNVPSSGGSVDLSVEVINNSGTNQDLQFWVTAYNEKSIDRNITAFSPVTPSPIKVKLMPGSNSVTLPLNIPANYLDGIIHLYINAGKNYGNPSLPATAAVINKGEPIVYPHPYDYGKKSARNTGLLEKEIPLSISNEGKVLTKGIAP